MAAIPEVEAVVLPALLGGPGPQAVVVADLDREANPVRIASKSTCEGLQVLMDERVVEMEKEVVVYLNDEEVFRGVPEPRSSNLLITGIHPDPELVFVARVRGARAARGPD